MAPPDLSVPLLTAHLPGVGGRLRATPDDFQVDELPAYEPSGTGDHLYLWVEKRGVGPEHLARTLADRAGVPVGDVGTAGLKDRHAVTRQWVSLPKQAEPRLKHLDGDGIRVLNVSRHGNKLKPGHLRGNRFRVRVREADRSRAADLTAVLELIQSHGLPNYYGPQRFGRDGSTVELGLNILSGRPRRRIRPFQFKFALSAVQSVAFNRWLARRLADGLLRTVLAGDVLMKWPAGGMFVSSDPATDQPRLDAREVVPGGPMFGGRMYQAAGAAAEREAAALQACGLPAEAFRGFGKLMSGTRRHALIYLDDLTHEWDADGLTLSFSLPAGSYATVLLAEVMKADPGPGGEGDATAED
jgi:tRNA pseudouridine13 synthase